MAQQSLILHKGYAQTAAGQVHYRHRPGTGLPVIFLHQTASSGAMWQKTMALWDAPHPLYAFDTPGFGASFDPEFPPTMADYARWIADAADALEIARCHLVGHHTGAGIALQWATAAPQRIASLALVGASCLDANERAAFAKQLGAPFRPVRSGSYLLKNWEYLRVGGADADIELLHRELIDQLRAWRTRSDAYAAAWAQDGAMLLSQIEVPILAIAARDDILFPSLTRIAALGIDTVTLDRGANFEADLAPEALTANLQRHVCAHPV